MKKTAVRITCTALSAILTASALVASSGAADTSSAGKRAVDGFLPEKNIQLYNGVTYSYYNLDTSGSSYGRQDFNVLEFDPAQRDLHLDLVPGGSYCNDLCETSQIMKNFAETNTEGKTPIAAINADLWMVGYCQSREKDIIYEGVEYKQNVKKTLTVPCGFNVSDGEIISSAQIKQEDPYSVFYTFGITRDNVPFLALPETTVTVTNARTKRQFNTDAVNRLPVEGAIVVYTDKGVKNNYALDDAYEVVIDCEDDYTVKHGATVTGTVTAIYGPDDDENPRMQQNRIILTARGESSIRKISGYSVGDTVKLTVAISDKLGRSTELLQNAAAATGGHIPLVIDGATCTYENRMMTNKYATSIIGYTEQGTIMFLTLDSNVENSSTRYFRISQMSDLACELGLVNAFLLDGGGSSSMVLKEGDSYNLLNVPNDGNERKVVNSLILSYGPDNGGQGSFTVPRLVTYNEDPTCFSFNTPDMLKYVRSGNNCDFSYDFAARALKLTASSFNDPYALLRYLYTEQKLDLSTYKYAVLVYRKSSSNKGACETGSVYFQTTNDYQHSGERSLSFALDGTEEEYSYVVLDFSSDANWKNELVELRFDFFDSCSSGDSMLLKSVSFYTSESSAELEGARLAAEANAEPEIMTGDVTGDGNIDTKDIVRLMKYLAGADVAVTHSDINEDNTSDVRDLIRLMKMIADD